MDEQDRRIDLGTELELQAPALVFPGQVQDPSGAHRAAYDLLARRAPREALELVEPALELDPGNYGLRSLRLLLQEKGVTAP